MTAFALGVIAGALLWVPVGRWSLLLLFRRSWRSQYLRNLSRRLPPPARLPHAGHLVQRGSVAVGSLKVPDLDTRVR